MTKKPPARVIDAVFSQPWMILEERLNEIVTIASRENEATPEALEAYRAQTLDRAERATKRGNVALIHIEGPLFKRANLFTELSGATSYDRVMTDLQAAVDDSGIDAIAFVHDSPGGMVSGCDELAQAIFDLRGKKPTMAYISGMAASASYWLASACDQIVLSPSSIVGSIGVVLNITDRRKADENAGVKQIEVVSTQSPDKRPDPTKPEGRSKIQALVDDLGDVFVSAVARNRGVTAETVVEKFGRGGVKVGAKAVEAGMADSVGQFEAALAALSTRGKNRRYTQRSGAKIKMDTPDIAAEVAKGQTAERGRISAIMALAGFKTNPALGQMLVNDGTTADAAKLYLEAAATDQTAAVAAAVEAAKKEFAPQAGAKTPEQLAAEHDKNKLAAGALVDVGAAAPQAPAAAAIKSSWDKHVGRLNAN